MGELGRVMEEEALAGALGAPLADTAAERLTAVLPVAKLESVAGVVELAVPWRKD